MHTRRHSQHTHAHTYSLIHSHTHTLTRPHTHRRVEALYNNIADDADELSFMKGDVMAVKEQINAEWLICSLDNETGIVPANYVRPVGRVADTC